MAGYSLEIGNWYLAATGARPNSENGNYNYKHYYKATKAGTATTFAARAATSAATKQLTEHVKLKEFSEHKR